LQRQGERFPWSVLRPEARVSTACTLVSLPGYRSLIALDAGPHLTLWGNLPEFSASPPVLESVVMLHSPSPGVDLDFTLDRGRVLIANHKTPAGPVHVRLRILRETWELELPDAKSEIGVELWTLPLGSISQQPISCFGLFTKGQVSIKALRQNFDLNDRARLSWVSQEPTKLHRTELSKLPDWWAEPPDRKEPKVSKALLSLLDWSERIGGSNADPAKRKPPDKADTSVVSAIKTQVEEELLRPTFLKTQRDAGIHDERGQKTRLVLEFLQGVAYGIAEVFHVRRTQVAQLAILRPTPHPLIRVGIRVMGGKVLDHDTRVLRQPRLDRSGLAVDAVAVPHHRPRPRHLACQIHQKLHDLFAVEVLVDQ
jgi:hypothetical protein